MPASAPAPATIPPLTWAMRLRMTRPGFLLLTVAACLLGLAWASAGPTGGTLQPLTALATVLLAVVRMRGRMCSTITTTRATVPMLPIGRGCFRFRGARA